VPGVQEPLDDLEDVAEYITRALAGEVWHANGGAFVPVTVGVEIDAAEGDGHHDQRHAADEDVYRAVMQRDPETGASGYFVDAGGAVDPERLVSVVVSLVDPSAERVLSDAFFALWDRLSWGIDALHWAYLGGTVHAWWHFDWDQMTEAALDAGLADDGDPLRVPGYGASAADNSAFADAVAAEVARVVASTVSSASVAVRVLPIVDRAGEATPHDRIVAAATDAGVASASTHLAGSPATARARADEGLLRRVVQALLELESDPRTRLRCAGASAGHGDFWLAEMRAALAEVRRIERPVP
jgi:hypothetical protein